MNIFTHLIFIMIVYFINEKNFASIKRSNISNDAKQYPC